MFPKEVQFLTVWLWWKFHLLFYFTLKLCKIVIVKIIKFISSKLHNLRAAEVLLNSLDFLGLQFYFPFLVILRCCRQSQIQFLLTLFCLLFHSCVFYIYPARGLGDVFIRKLQPVNELLCGDIVFQVQAAEELLHLLTDLCCNIKYRKKRNIFPDLKFQILD